MLCTLLFLFLVGFSNLICFRYKRGRATRGTDDEGCDEDVDLAFADLKRRLIEKRRQDQGGDRLSGPGMLDGDGRPGWARTEENWELRTRNYQGGERGEPNRGPKANTKVHLVDV